MIWDQTLSRDVNVKELNQFFDLIIEIPSAARSKRTRRVVYDLLYAGRLFEVSFI